jgi:phospholipase C
MLTMTSLPLRIRRVHVRRRRLVPPRAASAGNRLGLSRRRALQGLGALFGAAAVSACKDDGSAEGEEDTTETETETGAGDGDGDGDGDDDGDGDGDGDGDIPPEYEVCEGSDLSPAELLSGIDHIVVVMMENRTFDHFFGSMTLAEGLPVDGLTGSESNQTTQGDPIAVFNTDKWIHDEDPPHGWTASHAQFANGANSGFVTEYQADGAQEYTEVMGYYERAQLPVYYGIADQYVLCDRWFASVMGPTWPNRFYLHCADSGGMQSNDSISGIASVFDQLADAGVSHRYYYANLPFVITYGTPANAPHVAPLSQFYTDAENGELPAFCIIDPILTAGPTIGNDDHPPADVRDGQAFISVIHDALASSPHWGRCMLVVIYDEHGGFYDHVPPPQTVDANPGFEQLGFRIPSFVAGGQVRRGCVNGTVFDHASVAATVAVRWGLEPLNARVAATADLSSCIDPALIDNPAPPASLPKIVLPRTPKVHVPGANFGGQLELAAFFAKGERGGDRGWIRASQQEHELVRELLRARKLARFVG